MRSRFLLALLICGFLFCSNFVQAQTHPTNYGQVHFQNRPLGFISELPPAPPETNGSTYLYDDWSKAKVYLKDSTMLSDLSIKIDLKDQMVEILHQQKIRVLPITRVLSMSVSRGIAQVEFLNSFYVFASTAPQQREELVEVVEAGEVLLVSRTETEILEANYNPVLDVGRKDAEIVKKKKYLIVKDHKAVDTSSSKSRFRNDMVGIFGSEVEPMLKKVNLKDKEDLVALVQALNKKG